MLYATSQPISQDSYRFRLGASSPLGPVEGSGPPAEAIVELLSTQGFPFHAESNMQKQIWKKAILNSVWNSICPLLDVDNGIFARDAQAADLARQVVHECVMLTDRLNIVLNADELMAEFLRLSALTDGQFISTLQDIRLGRPTEIESLNLEIARTAASLEPPLRLPWTELLGRLVLLKSVQSMRKNR